MNSPERNNPDKLRRITQIAWLIYCLLMLFLVVILLGSAVADRHNLNYHWTELREVNQAVLELPGQQPEQVTLPLVVEPVQAGDKIVLTAEANTLQYDNALFRVSGASLDIYVDDVLVLSTGQVQTYPSYQKTPTPQISMLDLPTSNGLKQFRFEYTVAEATKSLELAEFYVGDTAVLFIHILGQNSLTLILSIMLLGAGVTLIGVSLLSMRATSAAVSIAWLGTSCLAFGLWSFAQNDFVVYMMPLRALFYVFGYVGMLAVVSPLCAFYSRVLERRDALVLRLVNAIAALLALFFITAHLSGFLPFAVSEPFIRRFMSVALVTLGVFMLVEYLQLRELTSRELIAPAALLALFALADLIDQFFLAGAIGSSIIQIGFLLFTIWMTVFGGRYINQTFEAARQSASLSSEVDAMASALDKQRSLYQRLTESSEQVRTMRHDMRHQLSALRGYLDAEDTAGALAYIDQLDHYTPSFAQMMITDNFSVNAVISHYLALATENDIHTDLQMVVPADLGQVSESDMSIIIGNLFENAIEASMYLPEDQRVIRIRSQLVKRNLTLTVDNAFDGTYKTHDGVFYSRKRTGKGIGLSSVQTIIDRYDGSLKVELANGQFMVSAMVKL
ncbi:MAG: GHKL domain-containing protein [Coriobacteriales bacterium]|jgi:signal transduction histidine kinase|nr:GHKL domain-containing protein [Coriobacteriales bacterium]